MIDVINKSTIKKEQNKTTQKGNKKEKKYYYGKGGRKTARAQVKLLLGRGEIIYNKKRGEDILKEEQLNIILAPLVLTNNLKKFDLHIRVKGGGKVSQLEAIRLGISRALLSYDPNLKTTLKKAGYLSRDPREKERKKYGLKRARKARQYRKR